MATKRKLDSRSDADENDGKRLKTKSTTAQNANDDFLGVGPVDAHVAQKKRKETEPNGPRSSGLFEFFDELFEYFLSLSTHRFGLA